ncbi:hypothetical protein C0J52_11130 [Blattella germanica]|nr:hypothetical protein C0J52_11130 [Blattella germanica]
MSINTAMKIFSSKIIPIITYGIEIFWDSLDKSSLNKIEKVKSTFLKKILCVSKYTPSRLTYQLTGEPFLIEDLCLKMPMGSYLMSSETNVKRFGWTSTQLKPW